jgi:hypothetical protein
MLHGAVNALAHYQSAMDVTLKDFIEKGLVIVYVDDLMIMADTEEELITTLIEVITHLWKVGFKISARKAILFAKSVKFCGRIYSAEGVKYDPAAVETVLKLKPPTTADELRSYICTVNWFRLAIPRFAQQVAPLQELLKVALAEARRLNRSKLKGMRLDELGWCEKHNKAFGDMNAVLAGACELAYPPTDNEHRVCVYMDASKYHWVAVVTVVAVDEMSKPHLEQRHMPLAFLSGSFVGSIYVEVADSGEGGVCV